MADYEVQRTSQSVTLTIRQKGKSDEMIFVRDVRGALVFPGIKAPGYAAAFGLRDYMLDNGKFPLKLLKEVSDKNPSELFKQLFNMGSAFSCRIFYADTRKENRDILSLFNEYARHHAFVNISLEPAPFIKTMDFGLSMVQEYVSTGGIQVNEGTMLHDQLSTLTEEDLGPEFEDKYCAVNALRYIVGSLESEPWQTPSYFGRSSSGRKNARGWT